MKLDLENKTALISGASRGIGLAIAQALAEEGCNLALVARGAPGLEQAAAGLGSRVSFHAADATDVAATESAVGAAASRWGGLDILVCNAGSGEYVKPGKRPADGWRRVLDQNKLKAINMINKARQRQRDGGAILREK